VCEYLTRQSSLKNRRNHESGKRQSREEHYALDKHMGSELQQRSWIFRLMIDQYHCLQRILGWCENGPGALIQNLAHLVTETKSVVKKSICIGEQKNCPASHVHKQWRTWGLVTEMFCYVQFRFFNFSVGRRKSTAEANNRNEMNEQEGRRRHRRRCTRRKDGKNGGEHAGEGELKISFTSRLGSLVWWGWQTDRSPICQL
jgi:hypothetical protein